MSVALLLLRIMSRNKIREWFTYLLIGLLVIINTICVAFIFAQCPPTRKLWEPDIDGHLNLHPHYQFSKHLTKLYKSSSPVTAVCYCTNQTMVLRPRLIRHDGPTFSPAWIIRSEL